MASPASTSPSIGRALSPRSTVYISAESVDQGGIATAGETPVTVAHYLGLTPKWVDGTAVGGCSFMIHVRHAATAIAAGLCETVLITHGESGRSGVGRTRNVVAPTSLAGQFEQPYGPMGPPTLFTIPVLRYMKTYGLTDARAIGNCLGGAARMGVEEPAPPSGHRSSRALIASPTIGAGSDAR
jgi:acetyl-CoA acetyltransferase